MKTTVLVRFKEEVFDAAGEALAQRLNSMGYTQVKSARVGKLIDLDIESADRDASRERVEQMCKELLAKFDT